MLAREQGLAFVHPFDDPDVIAGQGTIGMEILRQTGGDVEQAASTTGFLRSCSCCAARPGCSPPVRSRAT